MASTNQINKVVEFIAVLGDLIILNLCSFLLLFYWENVYMHSPFSCTVSLMMTSLSLCYLACSASRGKVWSSNIEKQVYGNGCMSLHHGKSICGRQSFK